MYAKMLAASKEILTTYLKNAWTRDLLSYHSTLLGRLNVSSWAKKTIQPFIDFFPGDANSSKWGYWDADANIIGLSLYLMESCPWTTIAGIFGHETAHQFSDLFWPGQAEREGPHGATFQSVCRLLEVDPVFAQATADVREAHKPRSPYGPQKEREPNPILNKVQKLLALSTSPESAEAEAALAAASRLMAKHNIKLNQEQSQANPEFERWRLPLGSTRLSPRASLIAQILQNHFFVRVVFVYEYLHLEGRHERAIEIVGRPVNLIMADHVFHFLMERTETLWSYHKPKAWLVGEKGPGAKSAFIQGLLRGFLTKLQNAEATSKVTEGLESSALILGKDAALERFYQICHPRLTTSYSRTNPNSSPLSRQAGTKAGEALTIHPPVTGGGGQGGVKGFLD